MCAYRQAVWYALLVFLDLFMAKSGPPKNAPDSNSATPSGGDNSFAVKKKHTQIVTDELSCVCFVEI